MSSAQACGSSPRTLGDDVGSDQVERDVETRGELETISRAQSRRPTDQVLGADVDEIADEVLGELGRGRRGGRLDGVLVELVRLAERDGLVVLLVAGVEERGDAAELEQLVAGQAAGERELVKVVVGLDRVAQGLVVLLLDVEVVDGLVDREDVEVLRRDEVVADQRQVLRRSVEAIQRGRRTSDLRNMETTRL